MSFARIALRTSRALRAQSSNPIQTALGARGQTQFANGARNYATAFERTKPHVNIGTIGHVDHGKVCSMDLSRAGLYTGGGANRTRPPLQQLSPSGKQRRATLPTSTMVPLIRRLKSASVVSPSPPPTSNTRPTPATTPTSTVPVTPITSRT